MEHKWWRYTLSVAALVVFLVAFFFMDTTRELLQNIGQILLPVGIGGILAFVLNVPVNGIEKRLQRIRGNRMSPARKRSIHYISIVLALLSVLFVIALLFRLVIPNVVETVKSIAALVEANWPSWLAALESHNIDTAIIQSWVEQMNIEAVVSQFAGPAGSLIGSIADVASSTVTYIATFVVGLILAIYLLFSRDNLARQCKKMLYAYVSTPVADKLCYVFSLIRSTYTKFLTGQCVEACILGTLIFLSFTIFQLPYAVLVGVVTAICALVPYIGSFISCCLAVLLSLMVSPQKALITLIVYLVVQFIETQIIYPRVVGSSVGLSPMWTFLAVLLGGRMFGLLGMVLFIPLMSVIYTLLKEDVSKRLREKSIHIT